MVVGFCIAFLGHPKPDSRHGAKVVGRLVGWCRAFRARSPRFAIWRGGWPRTERCRVFGACSPRLATRCVGRDLCRVLGAFSARSATRVEVVGTWPGDVAFLGPAAPNPRHAWRWSAPMSRSWGLQPEIRDTRGGGRHLVGICVAFLGPVAPDSRHGGRAWRRGREVVVRRVGEPMRRARCRMVRQAVTSDATTRPDRVRR